MGAPDSRLDRHDRIEKEQSKYEHQTIGDVVGDSTLDAFNDLGRIRRNEAKPVDGNSMAAQKKVHFADEESIYSTSRSNVPKNDENQSHPRQSSKSHESRPSSKSSLSDGSGSNQLADLNNMLKNNEFNIKEDDEQDFAVFLKQLQK